jgi:hypothetical protein
MQPAWAWLDPRLFDLLERFGAGACTSEPVFDGENWLHITASSRVWNSRRTRALHVWSAKNQKWQLPGAHGEGDFDLGAIARREARRALGLPLDAPLPKSEPVEVRVEEVAGYWNTPAHLHLEVVFEFETQQIEELPQGARWIAV